MYKSYIKYYIIVYLNRLSSFFTVILLQILSIKLKLILYYKQNR